jgi:UDP-N-acetylglucosamine transferase subunit ALG13
VKIFVSVGLGIHPFDRLLRAIDRGIQEQLIPPDTFIQTGYSNYMPKFCESKSLLRFDEIIELAEKSEIIISHAGVGTTLLCLSLGKIPVLFPRQSRFGEQVDDHQIDFSKKMEEKGKVFVAYDEENLFYKISNYQSLLRSLSMNPLQLKGESLRNHLRRILSI